MPVNYEIRSGSAVITLDEPRRRNALSPTLITDLRAALTRAAEDPAARSVILTHTGSTFCSGADLTAARDVGVQQSAAGFLAVLRDIVAHPAPVIAVVDGNVRAGGVGLVAACDIAYASPASSFATTETKIGVAPAMIALTVLPRTGSRAASRRLLLGELFTAEEAVDAGLLTLVTRDPAATARQNATDLLACSPQGLRETKALLNGQLLEDFDRRADSMAALSASLFDSDEAKEGMQAFLDKRPPSWAAAD